MQKHAKITDSEILNADELATLLGCDKETAAKRLIDGDLPGTKFGRTWIIPRQAFIERLNEKARDEAAARREALQAERGQAEELGKTFAAASPILPTSAGPGTKRGQRRQPPALPSLPAAAGC